MVVFEKTSGCRMVDFYFSIHFRLPPAVYE
ncbi:hypothetical protein BSG1_11056 [Bacillus sp. SG-1]|nr:hypothetical protein BSG1_11056 [Bacillus sp. SG-1]